MRCLKRRISDALYRYLLTDARLTQAAEPVDDVRRAREGTAGRL
jgi:hypothetical protein